MRDPFAVLGLDHSAREADIKSAYRTLAKKYHPDLYPGDAKAVDKFREICDAHDDALTMLKRSKQPQYFKSWGGGQRRRPGRSSSWGFGHANGGGKERPKDAKTADHAGAEDAPKDESFSEFLRGFQNKPKSKSKDASGSTKRDGAAGPWDHALTVSFEDAALGTVRKLTLSDGKKVELRIPAGIKSGQKLRIRTKPELGLGEQEIFFTISVDEHPFFKMHGVNVHLELPVSIDEAVLGAKIPVPTVEGPVLLRIPPGSNAGTVFRMRGKGPVIPESAKSGKPLRGDQFVSLKVVLPVDEDKNFLRLIKKWASKNSYSVRDHLNIPAFAK